MSRQAEQPSCGAIGTVKSIAALLAAVLAVLSILGSVSSPRLTGAGPFPADLGELAREYEVVVLERRMRTMGSGAGAQCALTAVSAQTESAPRG
ncbi:MAG TPA: hypothetical protein VLH79_12730 [Chthonomonadales bacterium]|nr:hypothetical protein [Chthonomonadales bacterium]